MKLVSVFLLVAIIIALLCTHADSKFLKKIKFIDLIKVSCMYRFIKFSCEIISLINSFCHENICWYNNILLKINRIKIKKLICQIQVF